MSGNITKTKVVAVTVQQPTQAQIVVTYQGGQDAQSFNYGTIAVTTEAGTSITAYTAAATTFGNGSAIIANRGLLGGVVGNSIGVDAGASSFSGKRSRCSSRVFH
jgi:hypothetical protein